MVGDDGLRRCPWALTHPLNQYYHDTEWGLAVHGESPLFERVSLEAFQAGLSWLTILAKRPAFRTAFAGFDAERVAAYNDSVLDKLMLDHSIVRNRAKIQAARTNAQAVLALRGGKGLDAFLWSHGPDHTGAPRVVSDIPTTTPASRALAAGLREKGFRFIGPISAHALMEAVGMVDSHLVGCHRRGSSGLFHLSTGLRRQRWGPPEPPPNGGDLLELGGRDSNSQPNG